MTMKKAILLLCMAAGLMSCAKVVENLQNEGVPMSFNVTVLETKATKTEWVNGDKIYVFFKDLATKYLILEYNGSSWTNSSGGGTLLDSDFIGLGTQTLTAVHFPVAVDVAYADGRFSFTSGGKPVFNYYLFEAGKDYTVDGTTVNATLSMGKPAGVVLIHVAGIQGSVGDYTFGCSKMKPVACASVGTDGAITENVLQAGARLSGVADSDGGIFAGRLVFPDESKDYKFTVASDDNIYTLTRSGRTLTAGKMYNFPALSETGVGNWSVLNVVDLYVDMGAAGKWAKCNIGASNPQDYGDYFAWGETTGYNEGKTAFYWSNYAWGTSETTLTKYCSQSNNGMDGFTDALTTLLPEDDAAFAALGGKFRMPTEAEWTALRDNTKYDWTWTDNYEGTGIRGRTVTSKSDDSKSIFLPAAGNRAGTNLNSANNIGYYWSSSLNAGYPPYVEVLIFNSLAPNINDSYRRYGHSVRPVYSE
jgi:hypothetical protein